MKDFTAPLETVRPHGSRLLEAFSPKLGRRVRLFDHRRFQQWLRLEADPAVVAFCERPARLGPQSDARLVDFWVRRRDDEAMLLLEPVPSQAVPAQADGVDIRIVPAAELAAAGIWIANWQRMLPVVTATRLLVPKAVTKAVLQRLHEPTPLAIVERDLASGDPSLVRGAIYDLLRTGRISAPSLHTQPLTLHTLLEPAS